MISYPEGGQELALAASTRLVAKACIQALLLILNVLLTPLATLEKK
jgi:hypothetical protein